PPLPLSSKASASPSEPVSSAHLKVNVPSSDSSLSSLSRSLAQEEPASSSGEAGFQPGPSGPSTLASRELNDRENSRLPLKAGIATSVREIVKLPVIRSTLPGPTPATPSFGPPRCL